MDRGDSLSSPLEKIVVKTYEDRQRKKKMKENRRFSDNQIMSLESMFEKDTKLEPERKLQLARELKLQPRQVAIWFQNRRARWKSKQLEQEYMLLKQNYDSLNSQYQSLYEEKQILHAQLQKLTDMLKETEGRSKDREFENEDTSFEPNGSTTVISNTLENGGTKEYDNEEIENKGFKGQYEEAQLLKYLNCQELSGSSSTPTDKWCSFEPSSVASNWLDFLT